MRSIIRLTIAFSVVLFSVLGIWYLSDHQNRDLTLDGDESEDRSFELAMSEVMAEDLTGSIEMFIYKIEDELDDWTDMDINDQKTIEELDQFVDEHPHIEGFALYENNELKYDVHLKDVPTNPKEKLTRNKGNGVKLSDPFIEKGTKKMYMGKEKNDHLYFTELDLSFIEHFVKDLAALTDANGQFFIGDDGMNVGTTESEVDEDYVKKDVEDLGWSLYVQSEDDKEVEEEHYKEGEIIVKLREGIDKKEWAADHQVKIVDAFNDSLVVRDKRDSTELLMEEWADDPAVVYMEPNYKYSKQTMAHQTRPRQRRTRQVHVFDENESPNDEFYEPYQWNFSQIFAEEGWAISVGEEQVPIAIIDSGVDPEHIDLSEKIQDGFNAFEGNGAYYDEHGHGTHVAGVAAAVTNNEDGVAGVSWNNPILAVKVLDDRAEGNSMSIAKGIRWAVDNGAKVLNLSLGDSHDSEMMHEAVRYAYNNDVVMIAASGNDNVETPMYPAAYEEVLTVAATDPHEERAFFSNYGHHIDVSAPGEHIPSTYLGNEFVMMSGTSMAAPHVAGLAGLIRSVDPDLSNEEVYDLIRRTCDDLGEEGVDPYFGHGKINVERALREIH
ncbi:S8 family peptidase [Bacillus shivajii]|uniref:S8 family peptidase n=1 Tax=Bacillus shivajii TaxID=1983719 RepID=UPI001CFC2148|nr:S8 family peptidase [Bacillus shivajii]UCZ54876.1 S8 family peptidase [Bacillus shivajii]